MNVQNIKAYHNESFSPSLSRVSPVVYFAPRSFTIAGFHGGTNSWAAFGSFIRKLNAGRDELPEATREKIKQIAAAKKTLRGKVDTLYRYMQSKVRYVNVSKGIQGWQPMEAKKVDEVSWGDCKALTNYMKSVLEAAGIKAYYTLVKAGASASPIISGFPSNQFNHAILCVPDGKDTIWLENTNQHIPPGYIGSFTDDRDVLLVLGDSVKMVHTPVYNSDENFESRKTQVSVANDGTCELNIKKTSSGSYYEDMLPYVLASAQKQKQALLKTIHLPTFDLKSYSMKEVVKTLPEVVSTMDVVAPHYGMSMGSLMLLNAYPFHSDDQNDFRNKKRLYDIVLRRSYKRTDTVVIQIPKGYVVAKVPSGKKIVTDFGAYSFSVRNEGRDIKVVRELKLKRGTYPPSKNSEFSAFLDQLNKYDGSRLVLRKQ